MEFEFDLEESQSNKEKYGIDFVEAQLLWLDSLLLEIPARNSGESRFFVVGKIGSRHWSAVITYCEGKVRIISARRSRKEEVEIYEGP